LQRNAFRYGFFQNPNLNEPWRWEFKPLIASLLSIILWLLDLLNHLLVADNFGLEMKEQKMNQRQTREGLSMSKV